MKNTRAPDWAQSPSKQLRGRRTAGHLGGNSKVLSLQHENGDTVKERIINSTGDTVD